MREHGVLRRVLLIYENAILRIHNRQPTSYQPLTQAAAIIRKFIENYHEKLEEEFLFPRFEKANKLTDLVAVLRRQHQVGRTLTLQILERASERGFRNPQTQQEIVDAVQHFLSLYRPHAAREDTVLFPAFHDMLSRREYGQLGDEFEKRENQLFGEHGFETVVGEVAEIEKQLGIYDLAQFSHAAK